MEFIVVTPPYSTCHPETHTGLLRQPDGQLANKYKNRGREREVAMEWSSKAQQHRLRVGVCVVSQLTLLDTHANR